MKLLLALLLPFAAMASPQCATCHAAIYASYAKTGMARSGGVPTALPAASFTDAKQVYRYSVARRPGGYWLDMSKTGQPPISRLLSYVIGSGATAKSFLINVDGFLYEAPATYYTRTGKWSFSPGYEKYSSPFLTRAITPACLDCHTSGVKPLANTQNGYATPPFTEGVNCERCHGPGAKHIQTASAADIINPKSLPADRRDSVCEQCHLSGDIRVTRAGTGPFTAGDRFADHTTAFVRSTSRIRVTSHVENLAGSACKRASGDRLWCGTCHDPHVEPAPAAKAAYYREKCQTCHTPKDCSRGDNCIACHMPKQSTSDADHVAATDHSIPRVPKPQQSTSADAPLVDFKGKNTDPRDLGLAYAIVALRDRNAAYSDRAFELLKQAEQKTPDDPLTLSYLADLYKTRSGDAAADPLYERLLRVDASQSSAPAALGARAMSQRNYAEAIRLWKQALAINPALPLVRVNLANALVLTGKREEARAVLRKALQLTPEFPAAQKLLNEIR